MHAVPAQVAQEHCDVCGRTTTWQFAIRNSRDYVLRLVRIPFVDFWICQSCGLVTQIPPVPASSGRAVYQRQEFRPLSAEASRRRSELARTVPDQANWIIGQLPPGAKTVLDVGAGTGDLLDELSHHGLETFGVEPTAHFADFARAAGHDVRHGYLEDADFGNRTFDVILLSHVLEHIHAPVAFLQRIKRLMHPGSVLFIEVPNVLAPYGHIWGTFFTASHVFHYNRVTLGRLLEKCGLHAHAATTVARGVRVIARTEPPARPLACEDIAPSAVAAAIAAYRQRAFTRCYLTQHLHWDVKLALHTALCRTLGESRGHKAFEGLRQLHRGA